MLGQKNFLQACRVTRSAIVPEHDGSEPDLKQERGLRSRESILKDSKTIYYKCKSCKAVFSKPVQCIVHYWNVHACNECTHFPEQFNCSSIQNHHLKMHPCPYKYQSFDGSYKKFWAELPLPSKTNGEHDDTVSCTHGIRTNVEVVADLRPILIYQCGTCDLTFENLSQLRVHVLCQHYCFSCSIYHLSPDILLKHHEKQHGSTFDCFRCTPRLKFPNKSSLVTHYLLKHYASVSVTLTSGLGKPCAKERHPVLLQQHINRHVWVQSTIREKNLWDANQSYNHYGPAMAPILNIYQYKIELKKNLTSADKGADASKKCKGLAVSIKLVGASNDVDSKTKSWARELHAKRQETVQPPDFKWLLTKHWRLFSLQF